MIKYWKNLKIRGIKALENTQETNPLKYEDKSGIK